MEAFGALMFTEAVAALQAADGSRETYARMAARPGPEGLGPDEEAFIATRNSFYMASVTETGWPYVQHRGGPVGFLKLLGPQTLGFADYRGNRQFISAGNLARNDRVSLFLMDYPRKARLKILGHATMRPADADPELAARLTTGDAGRVERVVTIRVAAFDWNCPQFITPRFTEAEIAQMLSPRLAARERELAAEIAALKARLAAYEKEIE